MDTGLGESYRFHYLDALVAFALLLCVLEWSDECKARGGNDSNLISRVAKGIIS